MIPTGLELRENGKSLLISSLEQVLNEWIEEIRSTARETAEAKHFDMGSVATCKDVLYLIKEEKRQHDEM